MILTLPLTGKVLSTEPVIIGDNSDPVRPIDIDLGNVSWQLVDIDLENDEATIEVTPSDWYDLDTGLKDHEGNPICERTRTTPQMKQAAGDWLQQLRQQKTNDELYTLSGNKKLIKPKTAK